MPSKRTVELARLLELPGLISAQERMLLGLKDDREKVERKVKKAAARVWLSEGVKGERNAEDRKASHVLLCEDDAEWTKHTDRYDELTRTIRKHEAQRDEMRREREGLRVLLEREFLDGLQTALSDKELARMVGGGVQA